MIEDKHVSFPNLNSNAQYMDCQIYAVKGKIVNIFGLVSQSLLQLPNSAVVV